MSYKDIPTIEPEDLKDMTVGKTVGDLMVSGNKIPFVQEKIKMKNALKILIKKGLGVLIIKNNKNITTGILTDGDLKRSNRKFKNFDDIKIKSIMKKNPKSVNKDMLATESLYIMNKNKITSLCVHDGKKKNKTIGIITVHALLSANIR